MNDTHYKILLDIQKELTKNTETTKFIHKEFVELNGRVSKNVKSIARINKILLIVSCVVGTLMYFKWPDIIKLISYL